MTRTAGKEGVILKKINWWKLIFVMMIVILACFVFRGSFSSILKELSRTKWSTVLSVCLCAAGYNLTEGVIYTYMAGKYNTRFRLRDGIACSYYTAFYRTATIGSGTTAASVYYLYKKEIGVSEGLALTTLQYMLQRAAVALFGGMGFFLCAAFMNAHFGTYRTAVLAGYAITVMLCFFLILLCVSRTFHHFLMKMLRKLDKKQKYAEKIDRLEAQSRTLREQTKHMLRRPKSLIVILLLELVKLGMWYVIPYITIQPKGADIVETACVTSLVLMLAGVIPALGGLGTTEGLFILFFSGLTDSVTAASSMLLYRFATYMLPCLAGAVCAIILHRYWSTKGD